MKSRGPLLTLAMVVFASTSVSVRAQERRNAVVTPGDPRAVYVVVLNREKGAEPEFDKGGARLLARWANRAVVELPPAAVEAMQKHGRVKYVQHLTSRPVTAASAPPESFVSSTAVVQSLSGGSLQWQTGEYQYDSSSNVQKIGPDGNGYTRRFVYDELDRLIEAGLEAPAAAAGTYADYSRYTYDSFGNRLSERTPAIAQTLVADRNTNRVTMPGATITYDGVGNMTRGGGFSYTYDPFNNVKEVYGSGGVQKMAIYNADDERIIFCGDGTVGPCRWTLRGNGNEVLREFESAPIGNGRRPWYFLWVEDSVYRDRLLAGAQRETAEGGRLHFHLDPLGSPRLITNAAGQKIAENEFAPFGRELTSIKQETQLGYDRTETHRFTGHERDFVEGTASESANFVDYMHARYYSAKLGRFLSVDPVMTAGTMTHPQMWNRYSYVMNSPLNFTDPTGRYPCKITLKGKDAKTAGVESGTQVDGECVERKAPPRSLFSFNFPHLSFALERRAQKAREGQPNKSTFTPSQCQSLFTVVQREAREGTQRAAARSSNTWGDRTIGQFNVDFNTRGNPTLSNGAMIDVDWFTDINSYTGNMPSAAPAAYVFGKSFWRAVGGTQGWPFQDPGEVTAVSYASRGASYNELYNQACP